MGRSVQMNVTEAKAKLSKLIAGAERGEKVLIARRGKPVVRLVAVRSSNPGFRVGIAEGEVANIPDFLEPVSEEEFPLWT